MDTSGLLQSKWSPKGFTLTLQETRSFHDSITFYHKYLIYRDFLQLSEKKNSFVFNMKWYQPFCQSVKWKKGTASMNMDSQ